MFINALLVIQRNVSDAVTHMVKVELRVKFLDKMIILRSRVW